MYFWKMLQIYLDGKGMPNYPGSLLPPPHLYASGLALLNSLLLLAINYTWWKVIPQSNFSKKCLWGKYPCVILLTMTSAYIQPRGVGWGDTGIGSHQSSACALALKNVCL